MTASTLYPVTAALQECINVYAPGTTFSDILWDCADVNDTLSWDLATQCVDLHGADCRRRFDEEYGTVPFQVDAGELLVWLGY